VLNVSKLETRAVEGNFMGYDDESKGSQIYWPTKCLGIADRDVYLNKDKVYYWTISGLRGRMINQHLPI